MNPRATFYVQLEPVYSYGYGRPTDTTPLRGARAVRMTAKKPASQKPGTVVVKLTVELPEGAFRPLSPEAVVTIPESLALRGPVEVTAQDPT